VINGKRKHELMEINNSLDILGESDDILLDKLYPLLVDPRLNDALKDLLNDQIVTIDYGDLVDVGFSKDIKTYKLKLEKYVHDGLVVFNDYNQYEIPPNTVIPSDLLGVIKASTFVYTGTDLVMRINEKLENSMQITTDTLYSILKIFKELNGVSGIAIQNGAVSGDKRKPGDVEVQSDEMEFTVSLKIETINEFKLLLEGPIGRTLANLRGATDKACLLQTGITMTNGSMRKIWYDPKVGKVNLQDGSGGLYSMKKETNRRGKQFN
jgi:Fe2+ or Zn2+ uptake regulation protein